MADQTDSDSDYSDEYLEQQYEQEYTDGDFLEAIAECSVASTSNVAESVGCNHATAFRRLKQLEEDGEIDSGLVGSGRGSKVWILPE